MGRESKSIDQYSLNDIASAMAELVGGFDYLASRIDSRVRLDRAADSARRDAETLQKLQQRLRALITDKETSHGSCETNVDGGDARGGRPAGEDITVHSEEIPS